MSAILELRGVAKTFGGLQAVRGVSLALEQGEILGVIGPNGAGKTTLINLITGEHRPSAGRIILQGREVTGRPPHVLARMGIARTFQIVRVFREMSVRDNVVAGALFAGRHRGLRAARARADEVLEFVRLTDVAERMAGDLGMPQQKRVQLARALAMDPAVLLLDEAMAGLNPGELDEALALVRAVHARGVSLIVIEHLMKVIMGLSHRVVVLHHGQILADGPPAAVVEDPEVVKAYFGERYHRRRAATGGERRAP
jgi:branched-chain amino acid transport system ATP-binding protein